MAMRGYAMTGGSRALDGALSSTDADVVARLRAAGAVIVGAANLHELAYGVTSENPHFGAVKNPRRPEHMAGGANGRYQGVVGGGRGGRRLACVGGGGHQSTRGGAGLGAGGHRKDRAPKGLARPQFGAGGSRPA